jgi:hypothetical protein
MDVLWLFVDSFDDQAQHQARSFFRAYCNLLHINAPALPSPLTCKNLRQWFMRIPCPREKRAEIFKTVAAWRKPEHWGPPVWSVCHRLATTYHPPRAILRAQYVQQFLSFFQQLAYVLPCPKCRRHYLTVFARFPLTSDHLADCFSLGTWLVKLHNAVSRDLGKPGTWTWRMMPAMYRCSVHFSSLLSQYREKLVQRRQGAVSSKQPTTQNNVSRSNQKPKKRITCANCTVPLLARRFTHK